MYVFKIIFISLIEQFSSLFYINLKMYAVQIELFQQMKLTLWQTLVSKCLH